MYSKSIKDLRKMKLVATIPRTPKRHLKRRGLERYLKILPCGSLIKNINVFVPWANAQILIFKLSDWYRKVFCTSLKIFRTRVAVCFALHGHFLEISAECCTTAPFRSKYLFWPFSLSVISLIWHLSQRARLYYSIYKRLSLGESWQRSWLRGTRHQAKVGGNKVSLKKKKWN